MFTSSEQCDFTTAASETPISEQEQKVLDLIRQIKFGEIRIVVRNSEIVQVEEKKSIKLK